MHRLIILVLDNIPIHHENMVKELGREGRTMFFHFIFLPPYLPHLNPIEHLWKLPEDATIPFFNSCNLDHNFLIILNYSSTLTFHNTGPIKSLNPLTLSDTPVTLL
jgi:transposase